jgi:AraC family transcriptional regulator
MFYKPLILDNSNWEKFRPSLHLYPLRISRLSNLESNIRVKSISLKYVLNGNENYTLGNKLFELTDNQFVVTNKFSECKVRIDKTNSNTGICIDLDENYFSDIIHSLFFPNQIDSLNQNISFFMSDELFSQGSFATGNLKMMLQKLVSFSNHGQALIFKDDFLRNITYELILKQQKIIKEFNNISAIKSSTKKELYARLLQAKKLILDSGNCRLTIKEIAKMVCLSEFRFHHLFKETFGMTPLKYQTKVMMKKAVTLYSEKNISWTEVSEKIGYTDLQTFSKVFKRVYGASPKHFLL